MRKTKKQYSPQTPPSISYMDPLRCFVCPLNPLTLEDFIFLTTSVENLQMVPHSLNHKLLSFPSTYSSFVAYDKASDHAKWSMPSSKVLPIAYLILIFVATVPFHMFKLKDHTLLAKNKNITSLIKDPH